jgi:hypothetical protein
MSKVIFLSPLKFGVKEMKLMFKMTFTWATYFSGHSEMKFMSPRNHLPLKLISSNNDEFLKLVVWIFFVLSE